MAWSNQYINNSSGYDVIKASTGLNPIRSDFFLPYLLVSLLKFLLLVILELVSTLWASSFNLQRSLNLPLAVLCPIIALHHLRYQSLPSSHYFLPMPSQTSHHSSHSCKRDGSEMIMSCLENMFDWIDANFLNRQNEPHMVTHFPRAARLQIFVSRLVSTK